jgi:hypothetical protein
MTGVAADAKLTRSADLRLSLPNNVGFRATAPTDVAIAGSVGGRQNSRKGVNLWLAHTPQRDRASLMQAPDGINF